LGTLDTMTVWEMNFRDAWVFWGLTLVPILTFARFRSLAKSRAFYRNYFNQPHLAHLVRSQPSYPYLWEGLHFIAWILTLAGVAGPQWGFESDVPLVRGRDLMLVLDMSNSMRARDATPSRFEAAQKAAQRLVDYLRSRPGFRLGAVVFAADAQIVCPLTEDLDQVKIKLQELTISTPPPRLRTKGDYSSGTSFATAMKVALAAHDPRMAGFQDMILLSDGDDPAGEESAREAARLLDDAAVPCYVVGIGDPVRGDQIQVAGRGTPVTTRLNEYPLAEIAQRSRGVYFSFQLTEPDLVALFHRHIEIKDRTVPPGYVPPQPASRASWFYLAAGILWLIYFASRAWPIWGLKCRRGQGELKRLARATGGAGNSGVLGLTTILLALVTVLAAEPSRIPQWERLGDQASVEGRHSDAVHFYRQALLGTSDPSRIAYKLGVAHFYTAEYRAAAEWFRATAAVSQGEQRALAFYNLGTCQLHRFEDKEVTLLDEAIDHFENCLLLTQNDALRRDAQQNLELAKLLRLRVQNERSTPPNSAGTVRRAGSSQFDRDDRPASELRKGMSRRTGEKTPTEATTESGIPADSSADPPLFPGATRFIPLTPSELISPLSPAEAKAEVRRASERIARERANLARSRPVEPQNYPDW
jgi:Ca-activated chloride channel family protein